MSEKERQAGAAITARDDAFLDDQSALFKEEGGQKIIPKTLAERFVVPPFSTLDGRQGYWNERKRGWLSLGIKSELGRSGDLLSGGGAYGRATSVFDPVLCELVYRWFAPKDKAGQLEGRVLDPFAGGSVRGIVAGALGLAYDGFELRAEQVSENRRQGAAILGPEGVHIPPSVSERVVLPNWHNADALEILERFDGDADLIFTCPPYADLEVYSDDPRDLSGMTYARFRSALNLIVATSLEVLKEDRFAAIVIGDLRAEDGCYRNLPGDVITAFEEAGARLYNQAIILTPITSAPQRATRIFGASRKLVPVHQLLQIFIKGSHETAAEVVREPKEPATVEDEKEAA